MQAPQKCSGSGSYPKPKLAKQQAVPTPLSATFSLLGKYDQWQGKSHSISTTPNNVCHLYNTIVFRLIISIPSIDTSQHTTTPW